MRDESQNALLKTLEEPPSFVHLILLTSEPEACSRRSPRAASRSTSRRCRRRCSRSSWPPTPEGAAAAPPEIAAAARLAAGDLERARLLLSPTGRELRAEVEACARRDPRRRARRRPLARPPRPRHGGRRGGRRRPPAKRSRRSRRRASNGPPKTSPTAPNGRGGGAAPRSSTSASSSTALWLRDLAALAAGAEEVVFDRDRLDVLRAQAASVDARLGPERRRRGRGHPPRPRPQRLRGARPRSALLPAGATA